MTAMKLARALGWLSVGLGLVELLAPRKVSRILGLTNGVNVVRGFGLREGAAGVGLLTQARPGGWLWARVAGDVVDLVALGRAAMRPGNPKRTQVLIIGALVGGILAVDVLTARRLARGG